MQFTDAVTVSGARRRDDGYLVVDARVARTGIQTYAGLEVDKPDVPLVRVYRPEDEVFSREAMASFAHRPITNDHPAEPVSANNWKALAKGYSADEIARDGMFLRVPLMVADAATIAEIESGKRELSAGYTAVLDWMSGTTPDGEVYDAVQRRIRANHIAVVHQARGGAELRIGDADSKAWGASPVHDAATEDSMSLRKIMVDGLQVEVTDAGAQAIEKLTGERDDARKSLSDAEAAHIASVKAKDEEIGTLKAEVQKAQDAAPTPADLDRMVADRVALVTTAKNVVADVKHEGLTDAEIRKAVVAAKLGDEIVDGASDDMVAGMFKAVAADAKPVDPLRATGGVQANDGGTSWNDAAFSRAGVKMKGAR
ncbi:DUF2213 domain-containing protein [Acuticoccus sp. M5D2P5]|uniref:DUF2213 domain-containing protein n=1 Tax=Acuticoccus kalidii TaxID=2910977 RepID=UPI001F37B262|nr:DUF2213 domain-containing protein [Acuticoccus kalidii]MCF3934338.1 DUF2213 domain-containing protein [Acuticoccus kalidii]